MPDTCHVSSVAPIFPIYVCLAARKQRKPVPSYSISRFNSVAQQRFCVNGKECKIPNPLFSFFFFLYFYSAIPILFWNQLDRMVAVKDFSIFPQVLQEAAYIRCTLTICKINCEFSNFLPRFSLPLSFSLFFTDSLHFLDWFLDNPFISIDNLFSFSLLPSCEEYSGFWMLYFFLFLFNLLTLIALQE